jgi:hypothetical protein
MEKNKKVYRDIPPELSATEKFLVEEFRETRAEVKEIRQDVNSFKIKATGIFATITTAINIFFNYGGHK